MTSEFFLRNFIKPIKWTNSSKKDGIIRSIEWTDSSKKDGITKVHKLDGFIQEGENIIESI